MNPSNRRQWQIRKCLRIWFLRIAGFAGQKGKCFPFWFIRIVAWTVKYASACVFACAKFGTSKLPPCRPVCRSLKSIPLLCLSTLCRLHVGQLFHPSPLRAAISLGKSESAFRFDSIQSSAAANTQVLANLDTSDRRLGWSNRKVLADLVPSDRRLSWANRKVLSNLNPSNRRQWQIRKCLRIWFLRIVPKGKVLSHLAPPDPSLHHEQFFT